MNSIFSTQVARRLLLGLWALSCLSLIDPAPSYAKRGARGQKKAQRAQRRKLTQKTPRSNNPRRERVRRTKPTARDSIRSANRSPRTQARESNRRTPRVERRAVERRSAKGRVERRRVKARVERRRVETRVRTHDRKRTRRETRRRVERKQKRRLRGEHRRTLSRRHHRKNSHHRKNRQHRRNRGHHRAHRRSRHSTPRIRPFRPIPAIVIRPSRVDLHRHHISCGHRSQLIFDELYSEPARYGVNGDFSDEEDRILRGEARGALIPEETDRLLALLWEAFDLEDEAVSDDYLSADEEADLYWIERDLNREIRWEMNDFEVW